MAETKFEDAVKSIGLGLLRPYLDHDGEPPMPFPVWLSYFEQYIGAANLKLAKESQLDESCKKIKLLFSLGSVGMTRFSSHPYATNHADISYKKFVQAVTDTFVTPVNRCRAIFEFRNRLQGSNETTNEFLSALRDIAVDCNFPDTDFLNRELAIQLVLGCECKETQEKLLLRPDFDLEYTIQLMKNEESARITANAIRNNQVSKINQRISIDKQPSYTQNRKNWRHDKSLRATNENQETNVKQNCGNCGRFGHVDRDVSCPARKIICNFCDIRGHYERCCRKKQMSFTQNMLRLNSISSKQKPTMCEISIIMDNDVSTTLYGEIDTGSDVTTMREREFLRKLPSVKLNRSKEPMFGYGERLIQGVKGYFETTVRYQDRECCTEIYVVPNQYCPVIGKNVTNTLGMLVDCGTNTVKTIKQESFNDILRSFPDLCQAEPGEYPDYEHNIVLLDDIIPKQSKLRSIPIALRESAEREVQNMIDSDIWEPVERSSWSHGMVVVPKTQQTSGISPQVRITTDLRPLNKSVIPFTYPTPGINDIFIELKEAKCFTKLDIRKGFFHIKLSEDCRHLTTTVTPLGLMQYKRMPMGLKDSSAVFQSCINRTLDGLPGVVPYIDDILVFGKTRSEHDENFCEF